MKKHLLKFNAQKIKNIFGVFLFVASLGWTNYSNAQCTSAFTFTDSSGVVKFSGSFTGAIANNFVNYVWHFGDGGSASGQNVTHYYTVADTFDVCLIGTDNTPFLGGCSDTICQSIIITTASGGGSSCPSSFTASVPNTANNSAIRFTGSPTSGIGDGGYWYMWNFGDGQTANINANGFTNGATTNHTYPFSGGAFYACLTFADSTSGCSSSFCDTVHVQPYACNVHANYTASGDSGNMTFTGAPNNGGGITYKYIWSYGDGTPNDTTVRVPSHHYTASGNYYVCLTAWDSLHNCMDTYCDSVNVNMNGWACNIHAAFTKANNNGVASFVGQPNNNAFSYSWDFGDASATRTGRNISHNYLTADTFNVCLTIADSAQGCFNTHCDTIIVTNPFGGCQVSFVDTNSAGTVAFYGANTAAGTYTYAWDYGDGGTGTGKNSSHPYLQPGKYNVCVTTTQSNGAGCTSTYCDSVTITAPAHLPCEAEFTDVNTNSSVAFTGTTFAGGTYTYAWDFGDGQTSNNNFNGNITHVYLNIGTYTVCLTAAQLLGNCTDSVCHNVVITTPGHLPCEADFTTVINGRTVDYSGTNYAGDTGDNYAWDYGDGSTGTGQTSSHDFAAGGTYTVCLTVSITNILGQATCTDSICKTVTVSAAGINTLVLDNLKLNSYPNPFSTSTVVEYTLVDKANVQIQVYDVLGNVVDVIVNSNNQTAGIYKQNYDASKLTKGVYLLKATINGASTGRTLIKE